jgi:hypothetical protein
MLQLTVCSSKRQSTSQHEELRILIQNLITLVRTNQAATVDLKAAERMLESQKDSALKGRRKDPDKRSRSFDIADNLSDGEDFPENLAKVDQDESDDSSKGIRLPKKSGHLAKSSARVSAGKDNDTSTALLQVIPWKSTGDDDNSAPSHLQRSKSKDEQRDARDMVHFVLSKYTSAPEKLLNKYLEESESLPGPRVKLDE